jgi:tRNA modification GTPase
MDSIFAPATPAGKSGIAIIRISGPNASNCLTAFGINNLPEPRKVLLHRIYHPHTHELIDEALIIWFKGPNSFTGEDSVEFHTHGSRAVINSVLDALSTLDGFRLANPGEFALRSFNNNKMDLTQIEGLADLIESETLMQQRQALRQMSGELEKLYEEWRINIIKSLSLIEAYIDFPDEDLPSEIVSELQEFILKLKNSLQHHLNDNRRGEKLREGLYATIIGAPNVGKSSLLNLLAKRDVAIVSHIAGTTRDIIEVKLDIAGYPFTIADTAGLRNSIDEIEQQGIARALSNARLADLKIAMFDALSLPDLDLATIDLIDDNTIVLINKIDQVAITNFPTIKNILPITISINDNQNIDLLLNKLEQFAKDNIAPTSDPAISRIRHRSFLQQVLAALERFDLNHPIELAAEDLRIAATNLGYITGKINLEEILDEIFSKFCIGK